ncbi:MAG: polysaccharide deacetylase [Hyphomicrobium sp.]|nr:polysaccharide deacetylase [Hyphomicrobium sp.]
MSSEKRGQIFYDPKGTRSIYFRVALAIIIVVPTFILTILALSLATPASLPQLRLAVERTISSGGLPLSLGTNSIDLNVFNLRNSSEDERKIPRFAFYNSWDDNSFYSLRANADKFEVLLPEWMHVTDASTVLASSEARKEAETRLWIQKNAAHLQIMPVVNNYNQTDGRWDGQIVEGILKDDARRQALISEIAERIEKKDDKGVVVDFKELTDESVGPLVTFLGELKKRLSSAGRLTVVTAPAYDPRIDFWKLSEAVDHVVLLGYDQHWEGGGPGPLSAQGWFETFLDRVFRTNTGTKFIIAVGSYAMDWSHSGDVRRISVTEAWDLVEDAKSTFVFDSTSLNSTFGYRSGSQEDRRVWVLDGVTGYNQIAAALAMRPGGLALWRLGTEDPTVWSTFASGRIAEPAVLPELHTIEPTGGIVHKGEGEVLSVTERYATGKRTTAFDPKYNLITSQALIERPRSLSLNRWGYNEDKLLALTFDDGPSRAFTGKVLDILQEKKVKATFFVVGANSALEPDLLRRMYREGHDIGNHTFTHPNLRMVGPTILDLELNATQRVLEAKLGVGTRLFRPPFNKDSEPVNKDEARTLLTAAKLGYITIGLKIDPLDWARPGVSEIVERTVTYAEQRLGNVILLHDGGGDRQQTVEALPQIIDRLTAKGYRFVPVHELLGLPRDEVMPTLGKTAAYDVSVNSAGLTLLSTGSSVLSALFLASIALGVGRLLIVSAGAVWQQQRARGRSALGVGSARVAVLVPAHNEEKVIAQSIASLRGLNYPAFEIIVIDDGSIDRTADVAEEALADFPGGRVLRKPNGGKASALNFALAQTDADVVVAIDADTQLDPEALTWLVRHFSDPNVAAVAGSVEVGNPDCLITRFQAIEYTVSQNLDRRAFETMRGIIVVPGAIGAWRRDAVMSVGGYDQDTLAEDADLTIKLQRAGWTVLTEPRAIARTEAPDTVRLFLRQRFRWMFGMLQVAWKHLDAFRQPGGPGIKYLVLPNILLFQFFFSLIAPVVDLLLVATLVADASYYFQGQIDGISARTETLLIYWLLWQLLEIAVAILAYLLDGRRIPLHLVPMLLAQRFYYRQLINFVAFKSLAAAIRGGLVGWDKLPRKGLVRIKWGAFSKS